MKRAVFLDRDGVINKNVLNKETGEWESPHRPEDFELCPGAVEALRQLQENQFYLFLVSNQPSYAKGKTSLENIQAIQAKFHAILLANKVYFSEYFYCYHHPNGVVPGFSFECQCRKPKTFFLEQARQKYFLDMNASWMVGDREADIICGKRAGVKTIMVHNPGQVKSSPVSPVSPDFKVINLSEAVAIIKEIS